LAVARLSIPPRPAHRWHAHPQAPQDSDVGSRRSRPRRRPRQKLHTRRKKRLEQRTPSAADDDADAAGPRAAVGAKVLVLWQEEWAPATGGWVLGTVVAVSDGSLRNPNGPGRVTRGWAVVRYEAEGDCHVHLLDAEHHHDARGDREMAWRLQPPAQAGPSRPPSPEAGLEDWDVSSAASPRAFYSESSDEALSGDGAGGGGEGGGAGGAGGERGAAVCDSAADGYSRGSLEEGLGGHANTAVGTFRTAGGLAPASSDMVRACLCD
jgi:hypothetical protein